MPFAGPFEAAVLCPFALRACARGCVGTKFIIPSGGGGEGAKEQAHDPSAESYDMVPPSSAAAAEAPSVPPSPVPSVLRSGGPRHAPGSWEISRGPAEKNKSRMSDSEARAYQKFDESTLE